MPLIPQPGRRTRPAVLCAIALSCLTLLGACGSSSSTTTLPPLHPNRVGPQTMFTPPDALQPAPAQTIAVLKHLGVDTIHVYVHWADIAPDPTSSTKPTFDATDPAAYPEAGWAPYDALVRAAKTAGIALMFDLVPPPPLWAEGKGAPHPSIQPEWKPSATEFQQFVQAIGTRYSGHYTAPGSSSPLPRISEWSIWNEPNLGIELAPEVQNHTQIEVSGELYRGIVNAAWKGLHATGHGSDTILIGELAPAGATFAGAPGLFGNMPALRFLRALYCVDSSYRPLTGAAAQERGCPPTAAASKVFAAANPGLFHASGVADHPYPQGLPPNEVTPNEPDYAELAAIGKLEHVLDTLQHVYGSSTQFPIWSTEFGYQTKPPDPEPLTVSPEQAADYLNWSEYITWKDPRIRSYDQYLLTDNPTGHFATGLQFPNGTPKPTYAAFRMPLYLPVTQTSSGHPLEVWGCVRPAHDAQLATHRAQRVKIQFEPASGGAFKTVNTIGITDRYGYFDVDQKFPGSGTVRLAWSYPHGAQVFSRPVSIALR